MTPGPQSIEQYAESHRPAERWATIHTWYPFETRHITVYQTKRDAEDAYCRLVDAPLIENSVITIPESAIEDYHWIGTTIYDCAEKQRARSSFYELDHLWGMPETP